MRFWCDGHTLVQCSWAVLLFAFLLLRSLPVVCFCKGGFRSSIAVSLLLREGFSAQDVQLGFAAISTYSPEITTTGEVSTEAVHSYLHMHVDWSTSAKC